MADKKRVLAGSKTRNRKPLIVNKMKGYLITQEQLEQIEHYQRMFELNAELVQELCHSEKDDIVYGFSLGKIHSHLRQCYLEMMELEIDIKSQPFDTKAK